MTHPTPAVELKPTRLPPFVTPDSKFFWDAADQGRFVGQKCGGCGRYAFPPRPMCPECHSGEREIIDLLGTGAVVSWTVPIHPPAMGFRTPPIVAVIRLDEGISFVSNVIDIAVEDLKPGQRVAVTFEETMNKHKVPVFRPVAK